MSPAEDTAASGEDASTQIARLRAQVEALMRERVTPVMSNAAERASHSAREAADTVTEQAEALAGQVRERPLLTMLIAAGLGYVVGRLTR